MEHWEWLGMTFGQYLHPLSPDPSHHTASYFFWPKKKNLYDYGRRLKRETGWWQKRIWAVSDGWGMWRGGVVGQVVVGDESGDKSDQAESPSPAKANQIFGFKNSSSIIWYQDDALVLNQVFFVKINQTLFVLCPYFFTPWAMWTLCKPIKTSWWYHDVRTFSNKTPLLREPPNVKYQSGPHHIL